MLIYLLSGCFCATATRLSHCHKEYTARHANSVDYQALYRKSLSVLELEDPIPPVAEWGQQGKLREVGEGGGEGEQPASVLLGGC